MRKNSIKRDYPTTSSYSRKYSKREGYLSKSKHGLTSEKKIPFIKNIEKIPLKKPGQETSSASDALLKEPHFQKKEPHNSVERYYRVAA